MDYSVDTDTAVYQALRIYRNALLSYCRARLGDAFGDELDGEIKVLFKKEWEEIERNSRLTIETGIVDREPIDALDLLSVNHLLVLLEKYWEQLSPHPDPKSEMSRKQRAQLTAWARELTGVRNPVAHAAEEPLSLRDALRYVDSGARVLSVLQIDETAQLRDLWNALIAERSSDQVAPPALLDTLPSREQITADFVGRSEHLADLWRWVGDDTRSVWALVGDGGKGKTTIAYEFAAHSRAVLPEFGLQGLLWLSAKRRRFVEGNVVETRAADFADLDTALSWILMSLGWSEETGQPADQKLGRCIELLQEFPMLIVADDIDSLDDEDEQAVEFFVHNVTRTRSKVLITSRRKVFGLGASTTDVGGLSEDETGELIHRRAAALDLGRDRINRRTIREIRNITDGSPLYIEDLLRLAQFYSLEHAISQWSGRAGHAAREYSLRRELEKLSATAVSVLGVLAYAEASLSMAECAVVAGITDEQAVAAMGELRNWNLLVQPGLLEEVPHFTCSRNLAKLMRQTIEGTDQEQGIRNGLRGLRGIAVTSPRIRAHIQQAVALRQAGEQGDAERTLLRGLDEVPNASQIHGMLGWLYSRWQPKPRVADAEENFARAEALGGANRDLYAHWADMEVRRGEFRKAVEICERSVKSVAQRDPFTWRLAGVAYTRLGQLHRESLSTEQAEDAFRRADASLQRAEELSTDSGDLSRVYEARFRLARACGNHRACDEILDVWQQRIPSDPYLVSLRQSS